MRSGALSRREWLQIAASGLGSSLIPGCRRTPAPPIVESEASKKIGTNWAANVTYTGTRLYRPGTLADVQCLVRDSNSVKALGGRHSFSSIANTRGAMVTFERFSTVSAINRLAGTVEVGAGVKYAQLCPPSSNRRKYRPGARLGRPITSA
jgi:xylitol oxidase